MRILVFMSDNRPLQADMATASYNSLVAAINYEYCKRHSYDFIYYRPYLDNREQINLYNCIDPNTKSVRHASWAKILSTYEALKLDYDYVVYTDSDCIFKDLDHKIEDFIKEDKDLFFIINTPWGDDMPCAGFYICKVGAYAGEFLKSWYNQNTPHFNKNHMWEQRSLWNIFKNYNIELIKEISFLEQEGQKIRHVGSCENIERINYFRTFIEKNRIDYNANMLSIKTVEFNTRM
jgi:Protein of unknown function, DUF273